MYIEDLDLRLDDEHARVHGKGGTVRTVLLHDRGYVALLKLYLVRDGRCGLVRDSLDPKAAAELRFDTNKTALGELTERLLAGDLRAPALMVPSPPA